MDNNYVIYNNKNLDLNFILIYLSVLPILSINLKFCINNNRLCSNIISSNQVKEPKTKLTLELSEFQKETIFSLMLGDLSAE